MCWLKARFTFYIFCEHKYATLKVPAWLARSNRDWRVGRKEGGAVMFSTKCEPPLSLFMITYPYCLLKKTEMLGRYCTIWSTSLDMQVHPRKSIIINICCVFSHWTVLVLCGPLILLNSSCANAAERAASWKIAQSIFKLCTFISGLWSASVQCRC